MMKLPDWLDKYKFEAHLVAFLLMSLPPLPLYLAAQYGRVDWIWALLGLVVLGNLLALVVR